MKPLMNGHCATTLSPRRRTSSSAPRTSADPTPFPPSSFGTSVWMNVISPAAMAAVAPDPGRAPDRLSARWLLALAGRLVRDVGALITGATQTQQRVATYALDGEIRFATPDDRAAFAAELTDSVTKLISKYHSETGRKHRIVIAVHPALDSLEK